MLALSLRWAVVVALGLLAGCSSQAIDDRAYAQVADVRSAGSRAEVRPTCPDPARPLTAECGLLAEGLRSEEFLRKFEQAHCQGLTAEACLERHDEYYARRLRERYHAANTASVDQVCDARPDRCDDPVDYERLLLRSHNARITERVTEASHAIEAERVVAQRRHREGQAAVVDAVTREVLHGRRGRLHCLASPGVGGSTHIDCQAIPPRPAGPAPALDTTLRAVNVATGNRQAPPPLAPR